MIQYHDTEWGAPLHDDQELFEFICLEGVQAGLSWQTILNKRENFRKAFDNFDAQKIVKYGDDKILSLLKNAGIIRNKGKINAFISNAAVFLQLQQDYDSFDKYIWKFVDHTPILNKRKEMSDIPARTDIANLMSKELKEIGFKFVGPTICYAFMQATGMVNDHVDSCFRYKEVQE